MTIQSPSFASVPLLPDINQVSAANANRDGTGTIVTVMTGPAGGIRQADVIEQVIVKAAGTVTDGVVRFFLTMDGGTTKRLVAELMVLATTPSGSTKTFRDTVDALVGMCLASNQAILYASTHNAEAFNIVIQKSGVPN